MKRASAVVVGLLLVASNGLRGQWLDYPTAGIPRLADGKPNLDASTPRLIDGKVDFSGMWRIRSGGLGFGENIAKDVAEVPLQPWATKLYDERKRTDGREHPRVRCLPRGIANSMVLTVGPFKIIHTPGLTLMLFEEFVTFRQIFTDGRPFPADADPAWWGYSVGGWDKDDFVVQTSGFKDGGWLDIMGLPGTDSLRVTERFRRSAFGRMEVQFTFDDPKAYTRPWSSVMVPFILLPDTDFIEHVCENERTYERITGK